MVKVVGLHRVPVQSVRRNVYVRLWCKWLVCIEYQCKACGGTSMFVYGESGWFA